MDKSPKMDTPLVAKTMLKRKNVSNAEELIKRVFTNIQVRYKDQKWLNERGILAPKNDAVKKRLNEEKRCPVE